jgi:non-specific serine/threonine protein kinase
MPPLKTMPVLNNLPASLSAFIGREREAGEVTRLLSANRLVTLTGPGGSGKTRLALKVSAALLGDFEHGTWFVDLSPISDAAFVPQAIATTLDLREQSGLSITENLVDFLSSRQVLLVMDNCEHLVAACAALIERLLQKCPGLKILATSREVLGLTGEVAWSVPPLSLPDQRPWVNPASPDEALRRYQESESVQLFVARAAASSPEFKVSAENGAWVAEICRRLDGMPLAIELAAARVRSLSVQEIARRLDDRFQLMTGGSRTAPPRQQTLRGALDWSYALLTAEEQTVLRRLSVFAGSASLEAAETVCASSQPSEGAPPPSEVLDTLAHLVDKSLVTAAAGEHGETRYRMLETIRQYALEKLAASGEAEETKSRHLDYFIQWAETAESQVDGAEQVRWLASYEAEHENLGAALEWCQADDRRAEAGLRLAAACGRFWRLHGHITEARMRLTSALSPDAAQKRTLSRARALTWLANHAYLQSDYPTMRPAAEEALSIWRALGEQGRWGEAYTLDLLGELATEEGDYALAPEYFQEAMDIYTELNDMRGIGEMHMQFGWAAMRVGDYARAESHLEEFLHLAQKLEDKSLMAFDLAGLGELAIRQGKYERATTLLEEGLQLNRERGDKWGQGTVLGSLGWVALRQGDFKRMREWLGQSLAVRTEISDKGGIAWCLEKLGEARYQDSQLPEAARLFGHAEALRAPMGSVIDPADRQAYDLIIAGLRSGLGAEACAALWAEGAAMPLKQAIQQALEEPGASAPSMQHEKERFGGLSARERQVAALIAQGKSNREIAEAMTVGLKTVETYVTRVLNKLGYDSRVQIATWAVEKGLV